MVFISNEERLAGGNVSHVYKSGDTVRRELKQNSKRVHALLKHLENKGYEHAPRFLGIDEKGREVLSFIEGEAGHYPLKTYMRSDAVLRDIAVMLRSYHDAVNDFPMEDGWPSIDQTPPPAEVLCHNDFAPYNMIFRQEKPIGIIDFDMAGPGPRLWDIAYTLYTCVPLSRFYVTEMGEPVPYHSLDASRMKSRVQLFFDSYGEELAEDYLDLVLLRIEALGKTITSKARAGDPAFQQMIREGHLEHYQKDLAFIKEHRNEWMK